MNLPAMDNLDLHTVFARNCSVKKLSVSQAKDFFDANHRMAYCTCRHRYGLFVERSTGKREAALPAGTLVAAAGFSGARNMTERGGNPRSFEWIRYASLKGYRVVGGMGKLMQAFVDDLHPDDIMTYVRSQESDGDAFRALGFDLEGEFTKESWGSANLKFRKNF